MNREIGLLVSFEIVTPKGHRSIDRRFEDRGGDRFTLPENFSGKADTDGNEFHMDQGGTMPFIRAYDTDCPTCSFMCASSWNSTAQPAI